jgi:phospholipase C
MRFARTLTTILIASCAGAAPALAAPPAGLDKIQHILVVYLENHSFDNMFALFPGADGLTGKTTTWAPQIDASGKPYATLPPVMNTEANPPKPDPRFPATMINAPFLIDQYVRQDEKTPDLVHRFYQNPVQIDGGKNDKFALVSDAKGLVMGYYDTRNTKMWALAKEFTLADHFFMGAFGGSFLNHMWLVCACTPEFPNAPDAVKAKLDAGGALVKDGKVTPDGFAVNTIYSVFQPHPAKADPTQALPPIALPNIGDRLSEKNIGWAWYSGGWNDAIAGNAEKEKENAFQFHHQPFAYFAAYGDGTPGRAAHLKDEADLYAAIADGSLPAVAFYKPVGIENQHPGYANVSNGDMRAADVIEKLRASALWKSTVVIVTYDENGGFWDHVAPPDKNHGGDRWGPATRVPTIVISPFAKRHFVDHTVYDTTAILKLIEARYGLKPLGGERSFPSDAANDLRHALTLGRN